MSSFEPETAESEEMLPVPEPAESEIERPVRASPADEAAALHPEFETADDPRIPAEKQFFKIGEVAKITGLKPYVLRYWESEFAWVRPAKTSSKQRMYRRQDVAMILKIKRLRYDDHHTIASAKEHIRQTRQPEKAAPRRPVSSPERAPPAPPRAAQLGLGFPQASSTAELARRLADMRRQVLDLLDAVKE